MSLTRVVVLDAGADINEHRHGIQAGPNLLHHVSYKDLAIARFLLDRGADPSIRDSYGSTPLHGVYIYEGKNEETINLFVDRGANVNSQDIKGSTPLHKAAYAGAYDTASILIGRGADRSIRNADGLRPVDIAKKGLFTSDYSSEPIAVINEELVELLRVPEEERASPDAKGGARNLKQHDEPD